MLDCAFPVVEECLNSYADDTSGSAVSQLPLGYEGPCSVTVSGRSSATVVLPRVSEAVSAAKFAVGHLGGYSLAVVRPSTLDRVTHQTWQDWAF